jgi:hypothetical protein
LELSNGNLLLKSGFLDNTRILSAAHNKRRENLSGFDHKKLLIGNSHPMSHADFDSFEEFK